MKKWHSRKALILQIEKLNAELAGLRHTIRQLSKDIEAHRRVMREFTIVTRDDDEFERQVLQWLREHQ